MAGSCMDVNDTACEPRGPGGAPGSPRGVEGPRPTEGPLALVLPVNKVASLIRSQYAASVRHVCLI